MSVTADSNKCRAATLYGGRQFYRGQNKHMNVYFPYYVSFIVIISQISDNGVFCSQFIHSCVCLEVS